MRSALARFSLCLTLAVASWAAVGGPQVTVDLDAPGSMNRLRAENPARYRAIAAILADAERLPEQAVASYLHTNYPVSSVSLGPTLLVSLPPKRKLAFELHQVGYTATVVVQLPPARATPAE